MAKASGKKRVSALQQAEGYLELELPHHALEVLESAEDFGSYRFEANCLRGEALRMMERHVEALVPLEQAAEDRPEDAKVNLALGWCYKRTGQLGRAIETLERAARANPNDEILPYNLACYWSLAGDKQKSLGWLKKALEMAPELRRLIPDESDFDFLRGDPAYEQLVDGK